MRAGSWWRAVGSSIVLAYAGEVRAQSTATIRGDVVQADTITRANGIVIVAIDTAGNETARALSGQNGAYSLAVVPGTYTLRALRIGYRPTVTVPITVAAGEVRSFRVILAGSALQLNLVRVEGEKGSCRITEERGLLIASLWDQARTTLLASTLSAGGRPFEATLASYRQYTPRGQRTVEAETLTVVTQSTTSGFHSVPAESLAASGYVTVRGTRVSYHAPDAHALLSPLFEGSHCFDVKLGAEGHPEWIGIAFRPARRGALSDIVGTLWLDRGTAELRTLEFEFTNLPRNSAGVAADGRVEFTRLLTGDWIIARWVIRTPETELVTGAGRAARFNAIGARAVGGFTSRVTQDGIEFFRHPGATLTVSLKSPEPMNSVRAAYVGLVGTMHEATANAEGVATISGFVPGTYRVVATTEFMTRVGAKAVEREVTVRPDMSERVEIALPSVEDAIGSACGTTSGLRLFFGSVMNAAGKPLVGARLNFAWTLFRTTGSGRSASVQRTLVDRDALADSDGQWRLCLPRMPGITLKVWRDSAIVLQRAFGETGDPRHKPIAITVP